jgi:rhodanese-related sulfurtransferase
MLPIEAHKLLGDALFVDVREADEYAAGHVDGSLHMPIGSLAQEWQNLAGRGPIVVVCQIGQRSGLAAGYLRGRGLDAHNLEGGLEAWTRAGLALTAASPEPRVIDGYARDLTGQRISP